MDESAHLMFGYPSQHNLIGKSIQDVLPTFDRGILYTGWTGRKLKLKLSGKTQEDSMFPMAISVEEVSRGEYMIHVWVSLTIPNQ